MNILTIKEIKKSYTLPTFLGINSETVGGVARNSAIRYVELVRPGNVEGLDTGGIIVPRDEKMNLVLRVQPADPLSFLRRIKEWAMRDSWRDVRVQIAMPDQRSRLVSIAREADAADVLFVRSEQVNVPTRMNQCTEIINDELATRAHKSFAATDGMGLTMWRRTYPLRYFYLDNKEKSTIDLWGSARIAILLPLRLFCLPGTSFFRPNGFLDRLLTLTAALTGFYVAALVAAATFAIQIWIML